MVTVNKNYLKLPGSYLFSTIAKKVAAYQEANPDVQIVRHLVLVCHTASGSGDHRCTPQICR